MHLIHSRGGIASFVDEDVDVTVVRIQSHDVIDDTAQRIEAFAHVCRFAVQPVAHTVVKAEHIPTMLELYPEDLHFLF